MILGTLIGVINYRLVLVPLEYSNLFLVNNILLNLVLAVGVTCINCNHYLLLCVLIFGTGLNTIHNYYRDHYLILGLTFKFKSKVIISIGTRLVGVDSYHHTPTRLFKFTSDYYRV